MSNPTDAVTPEDPTERTFTIGQVLSVAVGDLDAHQLFCAWGEFLEVVGYLLDDVPLLEDMPAAVAERARPTVLAQHPELAKVKPPPVLASNTDVLSWLAGQEREHGARLHLEPAEGGGRV